MFTTLKSLKKLWGQTYFYQYGYLKCKSALSRVRFCKAIVCCDCQQNILCLKYGIMSDLPRSLCQGCFFSCWLACFQQSRSVLTEVRVWGTFATLEITRENLFLTLAFLLSYDCFQSKQTREEGSWLWWFTLTAPCRGEVQAHRLNPQLALPWKCVWRQLDVY